MSTAEAEGSALDAAVTVEEIRQQAGDAAVQARLEHLQSVVDATKRGIEGAYRKKDRVEQDKAGADLALENAEADHAKAVAELDAFKAQLEQ